MVTAIFFCAGRQSITLSQFLPVKVVTVGGVFHWRNFCPVMSLLR